MKPASNTPSTTFDPVRLIQQHQAGVWRYLRAMGCESALAEDLTQETFLKVLEKPFQDYNKTATAAYLRKVAYNLFISHLRRNGRLKILENIEQIDAQWNRWTNGDNGQELLDALRECLEHLKQRARSALEMRFNERRSRAEIAAALEISEHGAKNLMQRAKKQLRTCIDGKMK